MSWTRGKIIGRGSSATVYAATCQNTGETIAVKSAEFHSSEFLTREAKILSFLNSSPYVIKYRGYEITKTPSTRNLLMEYAPYGTLTDVTAKNGGFLEEARVVCYTRQILLGLEYIHSSGIAHCDVKGSNVLVGKKGEAKIADFGCAKWIEPELITEAVKGTPAFMAPEVARGERQGKESDIWAVGCTVIEMLTGLTPWIGGGETDPVSVLYRVGYLGESPELPTTLTEQAKDFLGKCFEKEAKERWTASELLNHPFVMVTKPELVVETGLVTTNSPTSVTDQMFWRSVEVEEEDDLDRRSWWECHEDERIRVLSSWMGPTWDMDGGDWITVRRNND